MIYIMGDVLLAALIGTSILGGSTNYLISATTSIGDDPTKKFKLKEGTALTPSSRRPAAPVQPRHSAPHYHGQASRTAPTPQPTPQPTPSREDPILDDYINTAKKSQQEEFDKVQSQREYAKKVSDQLAELDRRDREYDAKYPPKNISKSKSKDLSKDDPDLSKSKPKPKDDPDLSKSKDLSKDDPYDDPDVSPDYTKWFKHETKRTINNEGTYSDVPVSKITPQIGVPSNKLPLHLTQPNLIKRNVGLGINPKTGGSNVANVQHAYAAYISDLNQYNTRFG